jgi:2-amino-4-hydroxy-6-hydroxymethyldihydropteridine diphosphokinase
LSHTYLVALGSNMRVPGIGAPRAVIAAALHAVEKEGLHLLAAAPTVESAAIGPSLRRYANSVAAVQCELGPPQMLALLQDLERRFGRTRAQRRGQRWRSRALDLDIVMWSGGVWESAGLCVPHREMRARDFVLGPATRIARDWRDPVSGLTIGQLDARLARAHRVAAPRQP